MDRFGIVNLYTPLYWDLSNPYYIKQKSRHLMFQLITLKEIESPNTWLSWSDKNAEWFGKYENPAIYNIFNSIFNSLI